METGRKLRSVQIFKKGNEVSYNDYPALLFTSFNNEDAPKEIPFDVRNTGARDYLSRSDGFKDMFLYIRACNSVLKGNTTTNYVMDKRLFRKIDGGDLKFCANQYDDFFKGDVEPKHGTVMFMEEGCFVYLILGNRVTMKLKGMDGHYICAAFFKKNFLLGFEEGIITDKGLLIMNSGYYEGGKDTGVYLSFTVVTLQYAKNKNLRLYETDRVKEKIYILE